MASVRKGKRRIMTLSADIANRLIAKGFRGFHPWSSGSGHERIYYKKGNVELTGANGFQAIDLDEFPEFVQACKNCIKERNAERKKEVSTYDLPF